MNAFEYVLTLFGLLLGLALTEALSGLARALKARKRVQIGWPTAMLGTLVACDVITFWVFGWSVREQIFPTWPMIFGGFVVTGTYYVAASLIFPADPDEDHDQHFAENYRLVLGGFLFCNLALLAFVVSIVGTDNLFAPRQLVITWSIVPAALVAILATDRRIVLGAIGWLLALYPLSLVWD